jgi:peptidoglycan hydrolase-like protein with peptidoglycan-binding domain
MPQLGFRAPVYRGYHFRPGFRYGPHFYGRNWGHYRPRWPWIAHGPFFSHGPTSSSFVAWAQSALATVFGPAVPQDGVFGPETRGFVQRFQVQQGLPATSDLDGATLAALQAGANPQPPPAPPEPPPPPRAFAPPPPPSPPQDAPPDQVQPPPRAHHQTAQSGEQEIAGGQTDVMGRGRWVRHNGRVVLIGA